MQRQVIEHTSVVPAHAGETVIADRDGPDRRPHIVIVGAGFGGLSLVRSLRRTDARITVIDRQNYHLFQPLLYQVATAGLSPADIAAPIRSILSDQPNARVLLDEVTGVDKSARHVLLRQGAPVSYDYLVIGTGARHSYFGRDEWADLAPGLKTIDDATRLRRSILLALERAENLPPGPDRDRELTFVMIGGGPTGVEMAGAVAELTRHALGNDFRAVMQSKPRILLIESGPRVLGTFPEALSDCARRSLEGLGVELRFGAPVTRIDAQGVEVGGERIDSACVIWCAGVMASPAAQWLGAETADRSGRVKVEPDLSLAGHDNIFLIGDVAACPQADGRPQPGVAPAAKQMGEHVARTLAARIAGRTDQLPPPFAYRNLGNLATIGRHRAVADFGRFQLRGTIAWLFWCIAHIYFLVGFRNRIVVGANWLWHYVTFNRGARLITGGDPAASPPRPAPRGEDAVA
ncbi:MULTISPECIES: NAD(P)/FAD-dependent oxidoreductase [unclassified Sphingomonas]|jgi:NADH dehydrogenase|uniref:NAD(P)/FAD-dependent oxidoreductase n=1 Tax=unclassified Sphingomonas TaxID=196159 RepID=UPI000832317E|nr:MULTISPECIES: NAD(P)/FAD-dependent oxidoreductase [unclassified Sphingomonas]